MKYTMPIVTSTYQAPPFYLFNGHMETIVPSVTRKVEGVEYQRERIETPDDDFLDLDWLQSGNDKVLIISHGLEGNSGRHYVKGMAKLFNQNGWDIIAWNNRSCGGEMNRQRILYHHGASYDLRTVVDHAVNDFNYKQISLVGMSLGGGQTLRYLGQFEAFPIPEIVKSAMAISVPCSLRESVAALTWRSNYVYEKKFVAKLKGKIIEKAKQYPDIDISGIDKMRRLQEFDDRYSGPLHGFKDAKDFYDFCEPYPFMKKINTPTLILNALNDPFLTGQCYPVEFAKKSKFVHLETPERGGHVGFVLPGSEFTYSELRALEFLSK